MQEIINKRTYRSKTFSNGDGTQQMTVWGTDVHYKDAQGNLQDVDVSFEDKGTYWQMTRANYRLYVAKDFGANQLIRFDNKYEGANHTIYYEPKMLAWVNNPDLSDMQVFRNQQSVQGVLEGDKITWANAFGNGIHFQVTLRASGFKKEIIIQAKNKLELPPTANHKLVALFRFQGDGLKVLKKTAQEWDKNGYFEAEDGFDLPETANALARSFIRPAVIEDASGQTQGIKVFWRRHNGSLWQAKVLPKAFLLNATYPVRADTVTDYTATSGGDGSITSGTGAFATVRAGTGLTVYAGRTQENLYQDASVYLRRLFFPFDTSAIPDGDTVSDAVLTLTHPHSNYAGSATIGTALVESGQASGTTLATSDWTPTSYTLKSNVITMSTIRTAGTNSTHQYTLNDMSLVNKTGYTFCQLLGGSDYGNTAPASTDYVDFWFNESATSSYRPKLTVTYATGGGSTTNQAVNATATATPSITATKIPANFPEIQGSATTASGTRATSHDINLPSGIVNGEILIMEITAAGTATGDASVELATITTPTGWTQLFNTPYDGALKVRSAVYYRTADGTEGSTVTLTTTGARVAGITHRINNWKGTPEAGTASTGNGTGPNPPSLTPSWGADKNLWIATLGARAPRTVSASPSGYSTEVAIATGSVSSSLHCRANSIELTDYNTVEDPGAWTMDVAVDYVANVIAIQPADTTTESQNVNVTVTASPSVATQKTFLRTLSDTVSGVASMVRGLSISKAIEATVSAVASMARVSLRMKEIVATVSANVIVAYGTLQTQALNAVVTATAVIIQGSVYTRDVFATVSASATIEKVKTIGQIVAATVTASATITKNFLFSVVASTTATATTTIQSGIGRLLAVTAKAWVKMKESFWVEKYNDQDDDYHVKY